MNKGIRFWSWLTIVCMALVMLSACGSDEPDPTPPTPPTPVDPNPVTPPDPPKPGFPTVNVLKDTLNAFGGVKLNLQVNELFIDAEKVSTWSDESGKPCEVHLFFSTIIGLPHVVNSGDVIDEEGKLTVTVTNEYSNSSVGVISFVNKSAKENLSSLNIQVGEVVNLLDGITFEEGITLVKTEMEVDGVRQEIADPTHFTPTKPGNITLIFTVQTMNGNRVELSYPVTVKNMEYHSVEIQHLKPKDILPVVGQINNGDRKAYEHLENLRIAECTRVRDMMWKYGAGSHSASEYQSLMLRLNTGMIGEKPEGFDNFELVGKDFHDESEHGHNSWDILCSIIQHANLKVLEDYGNSMDELYGNLQNNAINIFGQSNDIPCPSKEIYEKYNIDYFNFKKYIKKGNFLLFVVGSNITGDLQKKIYHEDMDLPDDYSIYAIPTSEANGKNDNAIDKHIMVTIGTDDNGDTDITYSNHGAKFPVGFHPDVLFSGRSFPYHTLDGNVYAEDGNYTTSFTNYTNLSMADLCFQMYAEVADVDELLTMIRATTLTNYIRLNGQTQNLHLINPAGFFLKYLMPTMPTTIAEGTTINLPQGYYHGVVFNIPGAEVNINGEWVPFNRANAERIKGQNPFTLKWRINAETLALMGYTRGKTVYGYLIAVDDKWNGLNITQEVTFTVN